VSSAIFKHAAHQWQLMRLQYERYLEYAYETALNGTGGVLVNKAGRALHIDGLELFTGPAHRARKYASEELIEHWKHTPRLSLAEFERQWLEGETLWHD
jgi:hypothetical protein